jgi:phosphatidylglycerophosphate synthase
MTPPQIWIDATEPSAGRKLWGMTLVERQVREMALRGGVHFRIYVTPQTAERAAAVRPDLHRLYQVEIETVEVAAGCDMFSQLYRADGGLILLAGDAVYDGRVLDYLMDRGSGHAVMEEARGALFLAPEEAEQLAVQAGKWSEALAWAMDHQNTCSTADLDPYVAALRLHMPAYIYHLRAKESAKTLDHLMYKRTFKGAIDGVARYGYYHLVRWITRHLASGTSAPNAYTVLSVLCVWGAGPLIAWGHVGAGIATAWCGVILDSVDGKLARLRLHLSDAMGDFEHVAAMPGLGLWFLATGWYLSGGQLFAGEAIALGTWSLMALFLADKICSGLFAKWVGRELFDYRPVDAFFHLIAARRNVALLLLTVGALCDELEASFYALVAWMAATFVFHLVRFVWVVLSLRAGEEEGS